MTNQKIINKIILKIALLSFFLVSFYSHAGIIPRYDVSNPEVFTHPFEVMVFEDGTQNLDVSAIAKGTLEGYLTSSRFNVKSTETNYWFAFTIINEGSKAVHPIVRFDEPYAEIVDINYLINDQWYTQSAGLRVPVTERSVTNRNPVFQIFLAPGDAKTVYMKLQSNYGMLTIGLLVESPVEFATQERLQNSGYFFYFGAIASLLLYNLFLYLSLREKLYLYYVLHGACYITWVLLYSGFDLYLGVSAELHYALNPITSFILLFLALFTRRLLQTRVLFPIVDRILQAIVWITLIFGLLCFIDIKYYQYLSFIALLTYVFLLLFGIFAVYKRAPLSIFYLSSMVFYFIGIIVLALLLVDIAPYNIFTRYFYLIGSLAEFTIFSFALAYRVKLLQRQNIAYQKRQIEIQIEAKKKLEREVVTRTKELSEANNALAILSTQDSLTGLGNRRLLDDWIDNNNIELKSRNLYYSIILCDIDFFKKYNDYYGHQKGDDCLKRIAKTIQSCAYQPNDVVIRYGGEEFILLLPHTDELGVKNVALRIQVAVQELMIAHADSQINKYVTLSLGSASSTEVIGASTEALISIADKRLYKAKQLGRNQCCFA